MSNADSVAFFERDGSGLAGDDKYQANGALAAGAGPSEGSLFAAGNVVNYNGSVVTPVIVKLNGETGENHLFAKGYGRALAVDPTTGNPIAAGSLGEFAEFDGAAETAGAPLSRLILSSAEKEAFSGINAIAADGSGGLYAATGAPSPHPLQVRVYGPPAIVPTPTAEEPSEVAGTTATLNGTVEPEGIAVEECFFEYGQLDEYGHLTYEHTVPCESLPPTDSNPDPVSAQITGLTPGGATYYLRLAATNVNGTERSSVLSFETAHYAKTDPATVTGTETATLNGTVRDEGGAVEECFFEWGLASHPGYEASVPCQPGAGEIPIDSGGHPVSHALSGLSEQTTYRFRLVIELSGETHEGEEETFETFGPPQISEVRARDATETEAKIEAKIDPSGFDTSYRFEWGPTESYGNSVPVSPESIGTEAKTLSATLTGLSAGTAYHYRVVATNSVATTETPDQILETLNACGLPEERCFELVSARVPYPSVQPGRGGGTDGTELNFQAAEQPGTLAYEVEVGEEDATRGGEILYQGNRSGIGLVIDPALAAGDRAGPPERLCLHPLEVPRLLQGPLVRGARSQPAADRRPGRGSDPRSRRFQPLPSQPRRHLHPAHRGAPRRTEAPRRLPRKRIRTDRDVARLLEGRLRQPLPLLRRPRRGQRTPL